MASNKSTALLLSVLLVSSLAISANAQDLCVGVNLNVITNCPNSLPLLNILGLGSPCCVGVKALASVSIPCLCQCARGGLLGILDPLISVAASVGIILGNCQIPYTAPLTCPY